MNSVLPKDLKACRSYMPSIFLTENPYTLVWSYIDQRDIRDFIVSEALIGSGGHFQSLPHLQRILQL